MTHATIAQDPLNRIVLLAIKINIYNKISVYLNAQITSSKMKLQNNVINVMIHARIAQDLLNRIVLLAIKVNICNKISVYLNPKIISTKLLI